VGIVRCIVNFVWGVAPASVAAFVLAFVGLAVAARVLRFRSAPLLWALRNDGIKKYSGAILRFTYGKCCEHTI
jgi:hypothetical protein